MAWYEINSYTDKPNEFKIFQSVDQTSWTTTEATIFENYNTPNSNFDMSSVYVNVDANCPWTDGKIWDTFDNTTGINEQIYENGEVSLMPVLPNAISSTQPSHTLTLGYGNYQNKKYYNFQSWYNPKQELVKYQHSNIMFGNWNQIGTLKFGGQAIIAVPYLTVFDSNNRSQTCDLYTYLNNYFDTFTLIEYIAVRFYTFSTTATTSAHGLHLPTERPRGSRWTSSYGYPYISMVPIIKNETVKYRQVSGVDLSDIEVSIFDTYVTTASSDNIRYASFIIFGATYNSNLKSASSTVMTHVLSVDKLSGYYTSGNYIYAGHTDRNVLGSTKEDFREAIRRRVAYFGLFFTDRESLLYNSSGNMWSTYDELFSHEDMHCGTIDASGMTHGDYTTGKKNYGQKQYGSSDLARDSGAKPITPGGGGEEEPGTVTGDGLNRYTNAVTGFGIGKKHYAVTDTELAALNQYIYDMSDFKAVCRRWVSRGGSLASLENEYGDDAGYKAAFYTRAGFGEYPTNNYISLLAFPFDIPGAYLTDSGFILGTADTSQPYYPDVSERYDITPDTKPTTKAITTNSGIITLDLGSTIIKHPVYKDFRAYEPYTRIELAVPYHGTVELQASEWLNHNLSVEIDVDLSSGASYAYVLCDGIPQYALAGTMGVSVPLTVQSSSDNNISLNDMSIQSAAQKTALKYGIINAGIDVLDQAVTAAMTDNVDFMRSIKTGLNVSQQIEQTALSQRAINYKVQHTADGRSIIGTSAPAIQFMSENQCRLTIHYPNMLQYNSSVYASTIGHACNRQGLLSSFSGYTVCSNINLAGIPCTDAEATLIIQQMQSGVIL